jgi:hypothetical protein
LQPAKKTGARERLSLVYLLTCRSSALGAIFISYRRSDSAGEAGRLSDDLSARFGSHAVFMDVDAIQPGIDFRKAIRENVGGCSVLLAVMGAEWLGAHNHDGRRRLDSENDYVRLEIATALKREIPVVPVLVRGAHMPKAEELPEDIRELAYRNSVELTHARWKSDVQVLGHALAPYLGFASAPEPVAVPHPAVEAKTVLEPVTVSNGLDPAAMGRVAHELAFYIGPIAELVVKRAAKRCVTLPDLCNAVAQEIDASADRARFLAACRH